MKKLKRTRKGSAERRKTPRFRQLRNLYGRFDKYRKSLPYIVLILGSGVDHCIHSIFLPSFPRSDEIQIILTYSTFEDRLLIPLYVCPIAPYTHFVVWFVIFFSHQVNKIPFLRAHPHKNFTLNVHSSLSSRSRSVLRILFFTHVFSISFSNVKKREQHIILSPSFLPQKRKKNPLYSYNRKCLLLSPTVT